MRRGFVELRAKVLAVVRSRLRAQGVALDPADLEACYSQAWQGLYARTLAGEQIENPSAWLILATTRRAIDEARAGSAAAAKAQAVTRLSAGADERDLASELDDRARLRELFEAMRSRLTARECEAAALCYLQGLSRSQAAARMGLSEARMRKLMEGRGGGEPGVAAKLGSLAKTIQAGGWCEQQSSLMLAYAFGILDPEGERHALALAHTRECSACRAHVAMLRGLAAALPPMPLAPVLGDGVRTSAGNRRRSPPARALHAAARHLVRRGVGPSLASKLAATGVLLIGAGTGYLALRPSSSPARAGVVGSAPAPVGGAGPAAGAAHSAGTRAANRPTVRRPVAHRSAARGRLPRRESPSPVAQPTPRGETIGSSAAAPGAPGAAREFTPERVSGAAPPSAQSASSAPSGTRSAEGEFGLE